MMAWTSIWIVVPLGSSSSGELPVGNVAGKVMVCDVPGPWFTKPGSLDWWVVTAPVTSITRNLVEVADPVEARAWIVSPTFTVANVRTRTVVVPFPFDVLDMIFPCSFGGAASENFTASPTFSELKSAPSVTVKS